MFRTLLVTLLITSFQVTYAVDSWFEHTIIDNISAEGLYTSDINSDGFIDIITGSDSLIVCINNGDNTFNTHYFSINEGNIYLITSLATADLDSDGDLDIIVVSEYIEDTLIWMENTDNGFLKHSVDNDMQYYYVTVYDIDNDYDMDIITFGSQSHIWFNDNATFTSSLVGNNLGIAYDADIDDYDNDSDLDIVVLTFDNIIMFSNTGNNIYNQGIIDTAEPFQGFWSIESGRINDDLKPDIVVSSNSEIKWYDVYQDTIYSNNIYQLNNYDDISLSIIDMDYDDDSDIICAFKLSNKLLWLENTNDNLWSTHLIGLNETTQNIFGSSVKSEQFDVDPDVEVVLALSSKIVWYDYNDYPLIITPIVTNIPPAGGSILYSLSLVNPTLTAQFGINYWTSITLPNGNTLSPIVTATFNIGRYRTIIIDQLYQNVPSFAPSGTYVHTSNVGYYPESLLNASFEFTKN